MKTLLFSCVAFFTLSPMAMAQTSAQSLPALGQELFEKHCALCHDVSIHQINDQGPSLYGVVGRKVASLADYDYSPALKAARAKGHRWTTKRLNGFLANPSHMYDGTAMPMAFSQQKNRSAVIAYLKSVK